MFTSKQFRNKKTGEIVTQVPIMQMSDYEEVKQVVVAQSSHISYDEFVKPSEKVIFKNEKVLVERNTKDISFYDLKDQYNDYKGFTRNVRRLEKATEFIKQIAQDERLKYDIGMSDICKILTKFNLAPHTYCGMD